MTDDNSHIDSDLRNARLRLFLNDLEANPPPDLDEKAEKYESGVWAETDCLSCASCCRNMSPVFTAADVKRIATHLRLSVPAFREKWLYKTSDGVWMNRSQPCGFLDRRTNRCTIYAVRPADCAGFPHLAKKRFADYIHMHKQNIKYCPATSKLIQKLEDSMLQREAL